MHLTLTSRSRRSDGDPALLLFLVPCALLLLVVFFLPLGVFLSRAVLDPEPTLRHFLRILEAPEYAGVMIRTFRVCGITTLCCLLLGYPLAYAITTASTALRLTLIALILIPFWTSVLVRMFAWMALLGSYGVVNRALLSLGIVDQPIRMLFTEGAVVVGMTHYLLPYMVLPLIAVMSGIPRNLLAAAEGLGASRFQAFRRIFVPLSMPGVAAGCLLVFIIGLGFFVTPALLGGPRDIMLSQLVEHEASERLDWGMAAALATLLVGVTLLLYGPYARFGLRQGAPHG